jgi:hypothetical protein
MRDARRAKVSREDKQRVRESTSALERIELASASSLPFVVSALRELVGAYSTTAYEVRISGEGIRIASMHMRWANASAGHSMLPSSTTCTRPSCSGAIRG